MKHRFGKILAIMLVTVVFVNFTGYDVALAAGYSAYAYSLNLKPEDSDEFIDRIRAESSSYTSSNSAVRYSTEVTQSHFESNTHNINTGLVKEIPTEIFGVMIQGHTLTFISLT